MIFFIRKGKEGEYWDFKQEWHERIEDLIKDIICFSNTVHNEDCYLIFGISDNLEIVGMRKNRRKQADIIAVKENPLENVSTLQDVRFVMKHGDVYKAEMQ